MSFWLEWHRELRRQAGDERLPAALRAALKDRARDALARAAVERPQRRLHRRSLAAAVGPAGGTAAAVPASAGETAVAVVEMRRRIDRFGEATVWLRARGYEVVRLGVGAERMVEPGVIDLSRPGPSLTPTSSEQAYLQRARLLVCESVEFQQAGYAANLPTLLLNGTDPFAAYPVRADGLFTLQTPVDLDTGDVLTPRSMLEERYFRNLRNYGYRANNPDEILAAVSELHDGASSGVWAETAAQQEYREQAIAAGTALAARVASVAQWGPEDGFLGDGRLARCQAERWL